MIYVKQEPNESWRVYTNRLAKLNHTSRRRVVRWLQKKKRAVLRDVEQADG